MKAFYPLFFIISLVMMTSFACSFGNPTKTPDKPTSVVTPTIQDEEPTDEPPLEDPDTAEEYFTETFDGDLHNYSYFNTGTGDGDQMTLKTNEGYLAFDLQDQNLWIYVTYNSFTYIDVAIEFTANNRGKNAHSVSLLCRYKEDEGWYEFHVSNGGLYWIYAYDATGAVNKGYNTIVEGSSRAVNQGKDVNTYAASCIGDRLTLTINGVEVKTIKDTKYKFRDGKVGFGVSSFEAIPILVEVDSFTISQP